MNEQFSQPNHNNQPERLEVGQVQEELRQIGEQVFRVVHLAPEDPDQVRERDKIKPEPIGNRPMIGYHTGDSGWGSRTGRRAPAITEGHATTEGYLE